MITARLRRGRDVEEELPSPPGAPVSVAERIIKRQRWDYSRDDEKPVAKYMKREDYKGFRC